MQIFYVKRAEWNGFAVFALLFQIYNIWPLRKYNFVVLLVHFFGPIEGI